MPAMPILLDYSKYITAPVVSGTATYGDSFEPMPDIGLCPLCNTQCPKMIHGKGDLDCELHRCAACGGWDLIGGERVTHDPYLVSAYHSENQYRGILRTFDSEAADVPTRILIEHCRRNPKLLYETHHTKFEELVSDVFKDFGASEVHHLGRPGDDGIDLMLILGDIQVAIDVKRRLSPITEPVSLVRHFIGVLQLEGVKNGLIVSTADHFSPKAIEKAESARTRPGVNIELIDFMSFVDMLQLANGKTPAPWERFNVPRVEPRREST